MTKLAYAVFALLLGSSAARAQNQTVSEHTRASIGPRALFYKPSDADHGAWGQGLQLKLPMASDYALQISLDRSHHTAGGANYKDMPLQFSLLGYYNPDSPGAFYLILGYGFYRVTVDGPGGHTETGSRPHVGAGLELLQSGRWSFDASYRFIWSEVWRYTDYQHVAGSNFHARGSMWTLSLDYRL